MWPNPHETADLVTVTKEIVNGKFHFLCSGIRTESKILSLYGNIQIKENPYPGIFYAEKIDISNPTEVFL